MTNSEILAQAEAIVHLGTIGETGKRHDAVEGMRLMIEKDGVSSFLCSGVLCNLLRGALAIVDGKGRAIPGGSYAVWKGDWQDLRDTIFKAYEVVNKEVA